jgi:hypothetical protein
MAKGLAWHNCISGVWTRDFEFVKIDLLCTGYWKTVKIRNAVLFFNILPQTALVNRISGFV